MSNKRKIGLPPGSVVYTGNKDAEHVEVHYMQYDEAFLQEKILNNREDIVLNESPEDKVDWYDLRGIHDTALIEKLGSAFGIHTLILEDVSDTYQRPKFEEYDNGIFVIIKALSFDKNSNTVAREHVSIFFKKGFVVSFQETESDLFDAVRKRIHSGKGRVRQRGADYLAYALLDVLVDNYFLVLEAIEERVEALETKLMDDPTSSSKSEIHQLKKELLSTRKSIAPLREAIGRLSKTDNALVEDKTSVFLRDLFDHTIQIMDTVESFRDLLNGLQDLFISEVSFKMNQVMQVLTIVATIFIPLTFLAGIYGMNFDTMPELHWENAYYYLLGIMGVVFFALLGFFRYKKWL
jgi:magnesium transporter